MEVGKRNVKRLRLQLYAGLTNRRPIKRVLDLLRKQEYFRYSTTQRSYILLVWAFPWSEVLDVWDSRKAFNRQVEWSKEMNDHSNSVQ